jgi:sulfite reductase beta subunit-like hemoprotein
VLPWDPDNTFGANNEMPDRKIYARFSKSRILTIVRDHGDLRARYKAKIRETMAAIPLSDMQAEIDRTYQQIADAAHADTYKGFGNDAFDWNPAYLKGFAAGRYASVADQVENGP